MVFKKFDLTAIPNKKVLISYFCNGLKFFIQAQIHKQGRKLDSWKKSIKKTINAIAIAACYPWFLMRDMNNWYSKKNQPAMTKELIKQWKDFEKNKSFHQSTINSSN